MVHTHVYVNTCVCKYTHTDTYFQLKLQMCEMSLTNHKALFNINYRQTNHDTT